MWSLRVSVAQFDARDQEWNQTFCWECTWGMIKFEFEKNHAAVKSCFFLNLLKYVDQIIPLLKSPPIALRINSKFFTIAYKTRPEMLSMHFSNLILYLTSLCSPSASKTPSNIQSDSQFTAFEFLRPFAWRLFFPNGYFLFSQVLV